MAATPDDGKLRLSFEHQPTAYDHFVDDSFVNLIRGPVGCLAGDTPVMTERGPIPIADIDQPMRVLSWNARTNQFQLSPCGGALPKGRGYLYRVTTPRGVFVAAGSHRVFDARCRYRRVDSLRLGERLCLTDPQRLWQDTGPAASPSGDPRWTKTVAGFLGHYAALVRRCGLLLPGPEGGDRAFLPWPAGAPGSASFSGSGAFWPLGDWPGPLPAHSHPFQSGDPRQTGDCDGLAARLRSIAASRAFSQFCERTGATSRQSRRSGSTTGHRPTDQSHAEYLRSLHHSLSDGSILSIERLPNKQTYWDLQVLETNNYVTVDGSIHHNSGKSTECSAFVMKHAMNQWVAPDGWRYAKWGIVRNTYGELTSTTVSTWRSIFSEARFGPIRYQAPIRHHILFPKTAQAPGLNLLIEFIALDRPKDVRRLLSWEGSGIWFNELREIEKSVFDAATARVGRYPSMAQGGVECRAPVIIGDTNPPDEDHWLYGLELDRPEGFSFHNQPGAVFEVGSAETEGMVIHADDIIHAAGTQFVINPNAENLPNLPDGYYRRMLAGKSRDWIRVYAEGKYGFVSDGKQVTPEYDDSIMCMDNLPVLEDQPLWIGMDIGGGTLQPAAIIAQRHPYGTWLIHAEVVATEMGLDRFADMILQTMAELFPGRKIDRGWGDPAGKTRDEIFETVAFQHMRSKGIPVYSAQSNSPKARVEAWRRPMTRLIQGKPGLLIHKRCRVLRAGLAGRWYYRRVQVSGTERYVDTPEKNEYSHPCFVAGTQIATPRGQVSIEHLRVGDLVDTPYGPRPITSAFARQADTVRLRHSLGTTTCTRDHPYWTVRGFVAADDLCYGDRVFTAGEKAWMTLFRFQRAVLGRSGQYSSSSAFAIIAKRLRAAIKAATSTATDTFTAWCGPPIMATSAQASTSIIATATPPTTQSQILKRSLQETTPLGTCGIRPGSTGRANPFERPLKPQLKSGGPTPNGQAKSVGPADWPQLRSYGKAWWPVSVTSAARSSWGRLMRRGRVLAQTIAGRLSVGGRASTTSGVNASSAAPASPSTGTRRRGRVRVLAVEPWRRETVYSIAVADAHCYFADDVLVSNCDAGGYLLMGGGEYREMQGRNSSVGGQGLPVSQGGTIVADHSFNI